MRADLPASVSAHREHCQVIDDRVVHQGARTGCVHQKRQHLVEQECMFTDRCEAVSAASETGLDLVPASRDGATQQTGQLLPPGLGPVGLSAQGFRFGDQCPPRDDLSRLSDIHDRSSQAPTPLRTGTETPISAVS